MKKLLLLIVLLVPLTFWLGQQQQAPSVAASPHPVSDTVLKEKHLRCGYALVSPHLVKDPNTGQFSGPTYDILTLIGETLGWKISWVEEFAFATATEGLQTRRYDILCAPLFARPNIMDVVEFVGPMYYATVNAYAKPDRADTFTSRAALNDPAVRIGMIDGTIPQLIAKTDFPAATTVNLPEMSDYAENMLLVTTGKADVTFVDAAVATSFLKKHPGAVSKVQQASPLRMFPVVFGINKGEQPLLNTLNDVVEYLRNNGQLDAILDKYDPAQDWARRARVRYQDAPNQ